MYFFVFYKLYNNLYLLSMTVIHDHRLWLFIHSFREVDLLTCANLAKSTLLWLTAVNVAAVYYHMLS